jgi:hypothetical protein
VSDIPEDERDTDYDFEEDLKKNPVKERDLALPKAIIPGILLFSLFL